MVIARGQNVVDDMARKTTELSTAPRFVMRIFGALVWANLPASPWGWRTVGVAFTPVQPER